MDPDLKELLEWIARVGPLLMNSDGHWRVTLHGQGSFVKYEMSQFGEVTPASLLKKRKPLRS